MNLSGLIDKIETSIRREQKQRSVMFPVSSGLDSVDHVLNGGLKRGYITEVYGGIGSGKTALAYQFIKALGKDHYVLYVDAIRGFDVPKATRMGLPLHDENLVITTLSEPDDLIKLIRTVARFDIFDLIVVDDLASLNYDHGYRRPTEFKSAIQSTVIGTRTAVLILNQIRRDIKRNIDVPFAQDKFRVEDSSIKMSYLHGLKRSNELVGSRILMEVNTARTHSDRFCTTLDIYYEGIKEVDRTNT